MADAIGGSWYREGYIAPIFDALNEDPPITVVAYMVQKIRTPGGAFLTPHTLSKKEPFQGATGDEENFWYATEADAQAAVDRLMLNNGIPDA